MSNYISLYTEEGKNIKGTPWNIYPRPSLKRNSFFNLNGYWDFAVTNGEKPKNYNRKILVPFPIESLLSGINEIIDENQVAWYKTEFSLPKDFLKGKVILNIGAVDQIATVYLNGNLVGKHIGGYEAFSFDITPYLAENNILCIKVRDYLSQKILPYGKQKRKRGGMWYTPVTGIWQTVWLESVPENYIKDIKIDSGKNYVDILIDGATTGEITILNTDITKTITDGKVHIETENLILWSPENPHLYNFKITTDNDEIESYFALRTLEIAEIDGKSRLLLNGKPYFFNGVLDQGYWSDGLFTPATPKCFTDDIIAMKSLGFNMLRKHIKVEPELFYYECDRLGMIVFQDMVNNSDYSFFRDTVLPTIGFNRLSDKYLHKNKESRQAFINGMISTVNALYNHPSICCWTIFNEGWGQFCGNEMYKKLKEFDSTRFIDTASGWFTCCDSDFTSLHIYFKKLKIKPSKKPIFISEFGGFSYKVDGHIFNKAKTYGYGKFKTQEDFSTAFCTLYKNNLLPLIKEGLCAAVYTQVSDVEDETNGLLTYDRCVLKVKPKEFKPISYELYKAIEK